jgi:hypothetical protein
MGARKQAFAPKFAALSIKTPIFSKKVENIFNPHPLVFNGFILDVGKNLPFLRKKTAKGVDRPK